MGQMSPENTRAPERGSASPRDAQARRRMGLRSAAGPGRRGLWFLGAVMAILMLSVACAGSTQARYGGEAWSRPPAGPIGWADPGHAVGREDGTCATTDSSGAQLFVSRFGFAVPEGAAIKGVAVRVKAGSREEDRGLELYLLREGEPVGSAVRWVPARADDCSETVFSGLGGLRDTWGTSWTPSDVNSDGFGVRISPVGRPAEFSVDAVEITVFYETQSAYCVVGFEGDLRFSSQALRDVRSPEHTGSVSTEPLGFFADTNVEGGCGFSLEFTRFEGPEKTLPTTLTYAFGDAANVEVGYPGVWLHSPEGRHTGSLLLTVEREGRRDPAGIYSATVTIVRAEDF